VTVVGATGTLGRPLVAALVSAGHRVVAVGRTRATLDALAGPAVTPVVADLADPASLKAVVRGVRERFGGLDLLVNNAGVLRTGLFTAMPARQVEEQVAHNLVGPIVLTQAAVRLMTGRGAAGGAVVNVSSVNAVRGYRGVAVYTAAKAGMDAMVRSLARELGPAGVRVNSVVPGFFASDMTTQVTDENRARIERQTPLGRLGTVDEVVDAVLYLASPSAAFVTGQTLIMDGGITC
jgi:3-oxoacyl-[acyl-carrier protein] reductase